MLPRNAAKKLQNILQYLELSVDLMLVAIFIGLATVSAISIIITLIKVNFSVTNNSYSIISELLFFWLVANLARSEINRIAIGGKIQLDSVIATGLVILIRKITIDPWTQESLIIKVILIGCIVIFVVVYWLLSQANNKR
jgi:uncharacterized membrane protein (DUF373 family)